jgi:hypothetical protein
VSLIKFNRQPVWPLSTFAMQARAFREGPESTPNGGTVTAAATAAVDPKRTYSQLHLNLDTTGDPKSQSALGSRYHPVNDNRGHLGSANAHMKVITQLLFRLPNAPALVTRDWNSVDTATPSIEAPK